jgi:hypothetical protein
MKKKKIRIQPRIHYCGDGFKGEVIKSHGIIFCGFCGKEFEKGR